MKPQLKQAIFYQALANAIKDGGFDFLERHLSIAMRDAQEDIGFDDDDWDDFYNDIDKIQTWYIDNVRTLGSSLYNLFKDE